MRNAALMFGIIAGLIGMVIGVVSLGYIELVDRVGEVEGVVKQFEKAGLIKVMGVVAPLLALAGGAMAKMRALWGGGLMLLSAAGMFWAFGWTVFTTFPIALAGLGGVLALAAGKPDEPKAHF